MFGSVNSTPPRRDIWPTHRALEILRAIFLERAEIFLVAMLAIIFRFHQVEQAVRPGQAADMGRLNAIGVLLKRHLPPVYMRRIVTLLGSRDPITAPRSARSTGRASDTSRFFTRSPWCGIAAQDAEVARDARQSSDAWC
jgi:hypothetical protein